MTGGTVAKATRVPRYLLAFAVVLFGVYALLVGDARVCRQEVPDGSAVAVEVCGPPAVTDSAVAAVLALVVLLLAPDLSEAGIAGVTVKRQIEEAKADAATARADVAALRLTMAHSTAQSSAQASIDVHDGAPAMIEALARVGLLKVPPGTAPSTRPAVVTPVSDAAEAFLVTSGFDAVLTLLPEQWRAGTLVGVVDALALVAGADLPQGTLDRIAGDPDGAITRALRGEPTATAATDDPAVAAVPVVSVDDTVLGALAVALPAGTTLTRFDPSVLAPAAEAFSAVAAYVRASRAGEVPRLPDGPPPEGGGR